MTGLEHDETGHPSANPEMHVKMMAKRRDKIKAFADSLDASEVFGDQEGDTLVVGWGSTWGPIRETVIRQRSAGKKMGHLHLRYVNPLPNDLGEIFNRFKDIIVVEMNDQGLYGYGQLVALTGQDLQFRYPQLGKNGWPYFQDPRNNQRNRSPLAADSDKVHSTNLYKTKARIK